MPRATTTVRISTETRDKLGRIAKIRETSVTAILDELVDAMGERVLLAQAGAAWERMAGDDTWLVESSDWEQTLADGLAE
jgi:hypothetical protein